MCGIVAIVTRPTGRATPEPAELSFTHVNESASATISLFKESVPCASPAALSFAPAKAIPMPSALSRISSDTPFSRATSRSDRFECDASFTISAAASYPMYGLSAVAAESVNSA